jgi:hypothetical protein
MGEMKNAYKILVGKRDEMRPLGRHRHKWKVSIKVYVKENGMWIGFLWLRIGYRLRARVNTVMKFGIQK